MKVGAFALLPRRSGIVSSCFDCVGFETCYQGASRPTREHARAAAKACESVQKGRITETVRVEGKVRGMSRKRAQMLVNQGRAAWIGRGVIAINHD